MSNSANPPIVVHIDWVKDHEDWFYTRERQLIKAALLYADTIELQSFAWSQLLASAIVPHFTKQQELTPEAWFDLQLGVLLTEGKLADRAVPMGGDEAVLALQEIVKVIVSRAVVYPDLGITSEALRKPDGTYPTNLELIGALSDAAAKKLADPKIVPLYDQDKDPRWQGSPNAWEGILATSLLGELEAFPNATLDVVLDVRDRLHFRAAIAEAAQNLAEADQAGERQDAVTQDLRVRVVDPALRTLREDLQSLGVRDTLARVTSDPRFVAASSGWLSIGAASGSGLAELGAIATAAPLAPAIAAIANEYRERRNLQADLRRRPYWFLHAADQQLHQHRKR